MDDMAAYYPPPSSLLPPHYPYYQAPPPPPPAVAPLPPPLPGAAAPLLHHHSYIPQQQQPPLPPPPPFASYSVSYVAAYSSHDSVRTLFIAGLPEDIKPREIYNLFREFPGYESSHLRIPNTAQNSQPFAFAVFSDQQSAIAAMQALNGMVFDLEKGLPLFIDFAKSNSRSKRPRTDEERTGSDQKSKGSFSRPTIDSGFGSIHMSGMGNSAYNMIGYPPAQSSGNADAYAESTAMKSSASPCPTLFVANLGANCTEEELIQLFARCPGFLKLKMQSTYGAPVAFVDFRIYTMLFGLGCECRIRLVFDTGYCLFNWCNELSARDNSILIAGRGRHAVGIRKIADGYAKETKAMTWKQRWPSRIYNGGNRETTTP